MAFLGKGTKLTSFSVDNDNIYIEINHSSDEIIVANKNKHVNVFSVSERRCLLSWSTRSGQELTSGTVFHLDGKCYIGVLNKRIIRSWDKEDKQIEKGKRTQVSKDVHRLFCPEHWDPLVLFNDGTVSWLSDTDTCQGSPVNNGIRWTDIAHVGDELCLVIVTEDSDVVLYTWKTNQSIATVHKYCMQTGGKPECFCLQIEKESLYLIPVETSGEIYKIGLSSQNRFERTMVHKFHNVSSLTAIAFVGQSYLVVNGVRHQAGTTQYGIGIWDMKFGILQAWQELEELKVTSSEIHPVKNGVCVKCGKSLYWYPVSIQPSTLNSALGKFTDSQTFEICSNEVKELNSHLMELADPVKTNKYPQFKRVFSQLMKTVNQHLPEILLLQQSLGHVVRRCLQEKRFWAKDELTQLIKKQFVPTSVTSELISGLAVREELLMINDCLTHLHDIPEAALITALKCFIRSSESDVSAPMDQDIQEQEEETLTNPFGLQKSALINQVLQMPYNDVFLVECIRKLDFKLALELIQYLHYLLATVPYTDENAKKEIPLSMVKVVEWICLVLDGHFTQLVLSLEARKLLVDLHQLVESQVHLCQELVSLEGILILLKERNSLPPKQLSGPYGISVLHVY